MGDNEFRKTTIITQEMQEEDEIVNQMFAQEEAESVGGETP
jgi:hypothetical protein